MTNNGGTSPAPGARLQVDPAPAAAPPVGLSGLGLAVVLTGFALSIVDFFIVNVALTTIGKDLHGGTTALELVVSGYGITYALGLVLGGRLGDAFGRRRLYVYGLIAFTLASLLCGVAPTMGFLIAARLLQGAAAAMLVPQVLATIQASTEGEARARAISLYGATAGLAAVAGQIIGGLLVSLDVAGLGWRSVFVINVPIGAAALLAVRRMPATRAERRPGFDPLGTVLFGAAMVSVLLVIVEGRALGWPLWLWGLLVVGLVAAVLLVRVERRIEAAGGSPLLPPSVLSRSGLRRGLLAMVPFSIGFGSFMFVYALVAQDDFGLGGLQSGAVLAPFASAFFVVALYTPKIAAALGRRIVTLGAVIQGAGLLLMALLIGLSWPHLPVVLVLLILAFTGVGQALIGPTLFRLILADVPPAEAGMGSGVLVTSQQTATAFGATVGGTLFLGLQGPLGHGSAAVVVLCVLAVFSVMILTISLRLPDPR
ncbi:MFS transporter [Kitasatospora sp. SUK 42]|uniref:MFS transporter n=1 Tax=Kitasatospora sp. SUK 42 TaxID=1588882 RepID=UPI0018CAA109|nr:MFS transporter [Kitasatospora sp. SUK 42]MBV2156774.1 MFS transporter [Kitasatospora sp. SUK 42]